MLTARDMLEGVLAPLLASLFVAAALALRRRGTISSQRTALSGVVAVIAGCIAGHLALAGLPAPPWEATDAVLWLVLPGTLLAMSLVVLDVSQAPLRIALPAVVTAGAVLAVLWPALGRDGDRAGVLVAAVVAAAGQVVLAVTALRKSQTAAAGWAWLFSSVASLGVSALVIALSGSQSIGQLAGAAAMAGAGALLIAIMARWPGCAGAIAVLWLVQVSYLAIGWYFANLVAWHAILLGLAPLLPGILKAGGRRVRSVRLRLAETWLGTLVILAIVLSSAATAFFESGYP